MAETYNLKENTMQNTLEFVVSGKPIGKARPRFTKSGHIYTPKETKQYEDRIKQAAWSEMKKANLKPTDKRVSFIICAYFDIPKSYNKQKTMECEFGVHIPKRPDLDNIVKAVLDGCNEVVYEDDCMVGNIYASKKYCDQEQIAHLHVKIHWSNYERPNTNI